MRVKRIVLTLLRHAHWELRSLMWALLSSVRSTVTVKTRQGVLTVRTGKHDVIGKELFIRGNYELAFAERALSHLRSIGKLPPTGTGTVMDIGANNGVISIGMLLAGHFSHAAAVEPEPLNFALLQSNVRRNGLVDRMTCLPCAASAATGRVHFELSSSNFGDHRVRHDSINQLPNLYGEANRQNITVDARTVDEIVNGLPDAVRAGIALIWIDVQGHEAQVFAGATATLALDVPVVAELWPYGLVRAGTSLDAFQSLAEQHWQHYWVWRRRSFVRYPISTLQLLFDELGTEGDYDNVIFTR